MPDRSADTHPRDRQNRPEDLKYSPFDKLRDTFLLLLTGAHRMVEINTRLRADPALCEAFGLAGCAEQSVVQDTLDTCPDQNGAYRPEWRPEAAGSDHPLPQAQSGVPA